MLDDVVFIDRGRVALTASVDYIREEKGKSVDELFREGVPMLTKLLKYEFRASFRELLPLYVALVGVAALVRPAYFRGIDNELTGITMMVYSALMIAIVVISILTIVQRFTRTMLGREAYLMLTLPVPVSVHVAAKLIVGVTVMIAGVLVATLSFFVMTVNSSMLILLKYFLQEAAQLLETLLRQNAYVLLAGIPPSLGDAARTGASHHLCVGLHRTPGGAQSGHFLSAELYSAFFGDQYRFRSDLRYPGSEQCGWLERSVGLLQPEYRLADPAAGDLAGFLHRPL